MVFQWTWKVTQHKEESSHHCKRTYSYINDLMQPFNYTSTGR